MPRMTKAQRAEAARNNPPTVDLAAFTAAYQTEKSRNGWCDSPDSYLRMMKTPNGKAVFADFPQWNGEKYDAWALNPANEEAPADGQISTQSVLNVAEAALRYYSEDITQRAAVDRILAAVGVTYVEYNDSLKVTVEFTMTADTMRRVYSRSIEGVAGDPHSLQAIVRQHIRDNYDRKGLLRAEVVPDPARTAQPADAEAETATASS